MGPVSIRPKGNRSTHEYLNGTTCGQCGEPYEQETENECFKPEIESTGS